MSNKIIFFLVAFGLMVSNQALSQAEQATSTTTTKGIKKELLNDWLKKINKKIGDKKIDFEADKPKEVIAIIGLRGWELQVKKFDLPNWLGEIATPKDKFLLGVDYAQKEKINSAIVIFESFIKNFPNSKAKNEAKEAMETLVDIQSSKDE
ncbi:MAG: hypothetical protein QME42_07445 [bacterium]|nr:hypothetical protein [bacterium]